MNFLSEKGDFIWKLYKGEKKIQNGLKIRHGHGCQLFLNGYQYFGNWFNNKANGKGLLMFPDKSYFIGDFENNKIKNGKMIYEWGSEFTGKYDENQKFLKGEFILDVDYNLKVNFNEGKIISGILYNKNNEDDKYEINFKTFLNNQTVFQDDKEFRLHIDREIIIKKEGVIKLQIKKKNRFDGRIQISVLLYNTPFGYEKISQDVITNYLYFNKKIFFGLYFKQSQNSKCFLYNRFGFKIPTNLMINKPFKNEKIEIPFLNNDFFIIEEGYYNNYNLKISKGIYKKKNSNDNDSENILVKNLSKISQNEKILTKKIDFGTLLNNIHKKKSGIKFLTNNILNKYFSKVKNIFDFHLEKNKTNKNIPKNKNLVFVQTSETIQNNNIFGNFNNLNQTIKMNQNENTIQCSKNFKNFNNEMILEKINPKNYSEKKQKKKFQNFQFSLFKNFTFRSKNKKKEEVKILKSIQNFFFKGNILYNQKEGYCYIRNEDGSDIRGFYKKGKKNGFCCKRDPKGIIIQGFYKENIPYGKFEKINLKGEKVLGLYNGSVFKRQRTNFYEGNKIEYFSLEDKDIIDGDCELILDKFRIKCCFVNGKIKYNQKAKICVLNENKDENELFEGDMILGKKELRGFFKERKENGKVWDIDLKKKIIKCVQE